MDKKITVLLPVYNAGDYLSQSIESILSQTFTGFEFIIINDGSTDNSLQTIQKYAGVDERIIVISRENKGLIYTLNEGIGLSTGKYIARMDQDDISMKHRLEVQYKYISDHELDICGGDYAIIDSEGNITRECHLFQDESEILLCMASNTPFPHPSVLIRKDFLYNNQLKYGGNGYRQAEDLDLWLNMFNAGAKFGNVDSKVLEYRVLSTSMSRVNHKKMMREADEQFEVFMNKNLVSFDNAFNVLFARKGNGKEIQCIIVLAALRYALLMHKADVIFKCFKVLDVFYIYLGFVSFLKLKMSKCSWGDSCV